MKQKTSRIHHIDPVTKIAEIELPMPTKRFITLQKTDPVIQKLRQQVPGTHCNRDTNI